MKEETFRCRYGRLYLYVEGEPSADIQAVIPENGKEYITVFHEIILCEGEPYTLAENNALVSGGRCGNSLINKNL